MSNIGNILFGYSSLLFIREGVLITKQSKRFQLFTFYVLLFCICSEFSFGRNLTSKEYNKYIKSSSASASTFNSRVERTDKKYLKKYFKKENTGCAKNSAISYLLMNTK